MKALPIAVWAKNPWIVKDSSKSQLNNELQIHEEMDHQDKSAVFAKARIEACNVTASDEDAFLIVTLSEMKDGKRVPIVEQVVPLESLAGSVATCMTKKSTRHYQVNRVRMNSDQILKEHKEAAAHDQEISSDDGGDDEFDPDDERNHYYPNSCTGIFPDALKWKESDVEYGFFLNDQSLDIMKFVKGSWRANRAAVSTLMQRSKFQSTIHAYRPSDGKMACLMSSELILENEETQIDYFGSSDNYVMEPCPLFGDGTVALTAISQNIMKGSAPCIRPSAAFCFDIKSSTPVGDGDVVQVKMQLRKFKVSSLND